MSKHIVFVIGEGEYRSEQTMPALAQEARRTLGTQCTLLLDKNIKGDAWKPEPGQRSSDIPGLEALDSANLVVFYLRFRTLQDAQAERIEAYVRRGGAVAGFRTSTHAFNYHPEDTLARFNHFGRDVFGAPWIKHYGHESSTEVRVLENACEHPVLQGVANKFGVRSWLYHVKPKFPLPGSKELLMGCSKGPGKEPMAQRVPNPVAWVRETEHGGRVFFTTLGHPEDFDQEPVRKLALNGLAWALD